MGGIAVALASISDHLRAVFASDLRARGRLVFAGYALLTEIDAGVLLHFFVGATGILIMYGVARMFTWYKWAMTGHERAKTVVTDLTAQNL
jgi:hypothetical protein